MNSYRLGEVGRPVDWNDDKARRILAVLIDADMPVPAVDVADGLSPALVDSIQAALLRRELAKLHPLPLA